MKRDADGLRVLDRRGRERPPTRAELALHHAATLIGRGLPDEHGTMIPIGCTRGAVADYALERTREAPWTGVMLAMLTKETR